MKKLRGRDVLVVLAVLVLLALLTLLFLKPRQPLRDFVFGDFGVEPISTNSISTNVVTSTSPITNQPLGTGSPSPLQPVQPLPGSPGGGSNNIIGTNLAPAGSVTAAPGINTVPPDHVSGISSAPSSGANAGVSPSPSPAPPIAQTSPAPAPTPAPPLTLPVNRPATPRPLTDYSPPSDPESTKSERTAELLAKDSSPVTPDKAPLKTADILAVNTAPAPPPPGPSTKPNPPEPGATNGKDTGLPPPKATATPTPPSDSPVSPPTPAAPPSPDNGGGLGGLTNKIPTHAFNSDEPSSNVVFILDHSLSMKSHGKSVAARQQLVNTLEAMNPAQKFYVLFFHSGGYVGMPAPGPVNATPDNIHAMTNWLFSVGHKFGSDPTKAVQHALELVPAPDTVWLLSDGKFSRKAIAAIRDANDSVNAHINTIGFYSQAGEEVLQQIAEENNGVYRFIPPPNATSTNAP